MIALAKAKGTPGEKGLDGMRGADGINGINGKNGIDGLRGADGAHGAKGLDGSKGEIGAVGPQGEKGEAGMVWRGTYRSDTQYDIGDVVGVSGSAYVCVAATNQAPPVGFGWELLVSRGAQGVRGIKGEDGVGGGGAAAAGTLTGDTLAANVINSSLTSVGTLANLTVTNTITGSVSGNAATATSATTAGTVTTAAQPAITSVGTLTGLTVSATIAGSINGNAATATSATSASTATTAGTVTTAAQPAITSVGTLTAVNTSGVITGTNTTASTSSTTGAVIIAGGVGIAKDSFINGHRIGQGLLASQTNLAVGTDALNSTIAGGVDNAALGYLAGKNVTTGLNNVMLGSNAGFSNTTGQSNMCIGTAAHYSNTTGSYNIAIGYGAGFSQNNNSVYNLFLGTNAGYFITSGNETTCVGGDAGRRQADGTTNMTASSNSVYIGYNAKGFNNSDNNTIVIGSNAIGLGANTTAIGTSSTTETKLFGQLTLDATACISASSATALALKTVVPAGTGVTPTIQIICPSAATSLSSTAVTQPVFSPSGYDTISVQASTTYMFDGLYIIKTTGTVTHTVSMGFDLSIGSAVMTNLSWTTLSYVLSSTPAAPLTAQYHNFFNAAAGGIFVATTTSAFVIVKFVGIMRVRDAGPIRPTITFSAAPGGVNTLDIGSHIKFYPIGAHTIDSVGTAIG